MDEECVDQLQVPQSPGASYRALGCRQLLRYPTPVIDYISFHENLG
jgi:hypothetical protein